MKRTYDVYPYWEDEENKVEVCFRFLDRVEHMNSREKVQQAWLDFDEYCYTWSNWLYTKCKLDLLSDRYDRPWFTVMQNTGLQQKNYNKIILDKVEWAGIQGILDQNEWEVW